MHLKDAVDVLVNGDGNNNAASTFTIGTLPLTGKVGTLTYQQLVEFWAQFEPYELNCFLMNTDAMVKMLGLSEFQNPLTGLNFQGTGALRPAWRGAAAGELWMREKSSVWTDGMHLRWCRRAM